MDEQFFDRLLSIVEKGAKYASVIVAVVTVVLKAYYQIKNRLERECPDVQPAEPGVAAQRGEASSQTDKITSP